MTTAVKHVVPQIPMDGSYIEHATQVTVLKTSEITSTVIKTVR